jgi:16S rRNA (guanine527-N7)-methyltransferase
MLFLKGGDLAAEISESRLRPYQWDIHEIFPEEWYREKYLLYVPS